MTSARCKLNLVPFTAVRFNDSFWAPRIETNRSSTIPHIYCKLEETGRISVFNLNFERIVPSPVVLIFGDSVPAKWIEAACYSLATPPDPELAALVDQVVDKVISAQQPDGYLNIHFIHTQPEMRWKNLRDWHELYCAGHLIESAMAHQQATGERKSLDALSRYADRISLDPEDIARNFTDEYRADLLGGVSVIRGHGYAIDEAGWQGALYRNEASAEKEVKITAVPCCVWDNRQPGEMRVWLRAQNK